MKLIIHLNTRSLCLLSRRSPGNTVLNTKPHVDIDMSSAVSGASSSSVSGSRSTKYSKLNDPDNTTDFKNTQVDSKDDSNETEGLDGPGDVEMITLLSKDGTKVSTNVDVINHSVLLKETHESDKTADTII